MSMDHRNNQQKPPTTTMNEPPAETVAWLKQSAKLDGSTYSQILLMILERLELLENAQQAAPAGGLVERVADAIVEAMVIDDLAAACAAIREVAAWMRKNETGYNAVRLLEREADRG